MPSRRLVWLIAVPAALVLAVPARGDKPPAKAWFVDDDELLSKLTEKLGKLAGDGKCLAPEKLKTKVMGDRRCRVAPAKPGEKRLDPEEVYEQALPSVFVLGSVVKGEDEDGNEAFLDGRMATAWAVAADGVLVTNCHVFDGVEDGEFYGVVDHRGTAYPLTDVLAVDKAADIAVVRVAAKGLTPLPLAEKPAAVGSWVGVLGHPGDRYFTFTQGAVSRYSTVKYEDGGVERWMAVTADYAYGSSGSPVLDRRGAVVGMAALTETIDSGDPAPPTVALRKRARRAPPKPEKEQKPDPGQPAVVQMVVKLTVPAGEIRKAVSAE